MKQRNKLSLTGAGGITVTVRGDSVSPNGTRMLTYSCDYMRFFHSELMTHRLLSKCAASSRAITVASMHENIRANTARPIEFGKNKRGMQATEMLDPATAAIVATFWDSARDAALSYAAAMHALGVHKQIANRVTEPFQMMRTTISGTEWANIKHLRHHEMALPEFYELLDLLIKAEAQSEPFLLQPGQWHLPYLHTHKTATGEVQYYTSDNEQVSDINDALRISTSCCAQTSYRKNDETLEKATSLFATLIESQPVHASPVEHQATPMEIESITDVNVMHPINWQPGVTHMDRAGKLWSGNLRGFIQHRKLIANEAVWD